MTPRVAFVLSALAFILGQSPRSAHADGCFDLGQTPTSAFANIVSILSYPCGRGNAAVSNGFVIRERLSHGSSAVWVVTTRHSIEHYRNDGSCKVTVGFVDIGGELQVKHVAATVVATANANDLALLLVEPPSFFSGQGLALHTAGSDTAGSDTAGSDTTYTYLGRWDGRTQVVTSTLTLQQTEVSGLRHLLPYSIARRLNDLPWINMEVLYFDGSLKSGVSGGPILDSNGCVVGVVEGGLQSGSTWAIPAPAVRALLNNQPNPEPLADGILDHARELLYSTEARTAITRLSRRIRGHTVVFVGAIFGPGSNQILFGVRLGFSGEFRDPSGSHEHAPFFRAELLGATVYDGGIRWLSPAGRRVEQEDAVWGGMVGVAGGLGGRFRRASDVVVEADVGGAAGFLRSRNRNHLWTSVEGHLRVSFYPAAERALLGGGIDVYAGAIRLPVNERFYRIDGSTETVDAWHGWLGIGGHLAF